MIEARHIICPLCDMGFVTFLQDLSYKIEGHSGYWEKLKCPKCGTEIYVSDTEKNALLVGDVAARKVRFIFR